MKKRKSQTINIQSRRTQENDTDWWNEISDAERTSILRGLEDIKAGRVLPHEEVRKKYSKWLKK